MMSPGYWRPSPPITFLMYEEDRRQGFEFLSIFSQYSQSSLEKGTGTSPGFPYNCGQSISRLVFAFKIIEAKLFCFFSRGRGLFSLSLIPVNTHQCRATESIRRSLATLSGLSSRVSSRPNPLVLKSLNMASHPHLMP